jgi:hypothetical protein
MNVAWSGCSDIQLGCQHLFEEIRVALNKPGMRRGIGPAFLRGLQIAAAFLWRLRLRHPPPVPVLRRKKRSGSARCRKPSRAGGVKRSSSPRNFGLSEADFALPASE